MSIASLLERLSELFPKQDYQTRLERYIKSHNPQTAAEVEHYAMAFERKNFTGSKL
jgi:hypothetical protein